jgi:tripartite-type tricarboxylate transporter receptor subunit TctC
MRFCVTRHVIAVALALLVLVAGYSTAAQATATAVQAYPNRPLRLVVGLAPGGTQDLIARAVSRQLAARLGQNVVIDNREGATGIIATDRIAKAAPNGHTSGPLASAPTWRKAEHFHETNIGSKDAGKFLDGQYRPLISVLTNLGGVAK